VFLRGDFSLKKSFYPSKEESFRESFVSGSHDPTRSADSEL
jgi:hypothetical protein